MSIQAVIATINAMQAAGIIERYAIGGAVGATFYLEPAATFDIDISFQPEPGYFIISPRAIFDYLGERGCVTQGEYIVVTGWPVQFLPPTGPLAEEALREAVHRDIAGTFAWVFTAEHLAAIALETARAKDKARLLEFVEAGALDRGRFLAILARHGLELAWTRFERDFVTNSQ